MAEAFEYAVRKDIRNNPIVREVDAERHAELSKTLGLAALVVVAVMFWTWQHFELLRHGYRLEELQKQQAVEEDINRHLHLEIDTLRSPKRIETLARTRLNLVTPSREDAIVIERVVPAEPPARSVVARRD
jgi:cell division protein FtsL